MYFHSKIKILGLLLLGLMLYSFSCDDGCGNTLCENEGYCIDGRCECPTGFNGEFCENRRKPATMRINKIKIVDYNRVNSQGNPWDQGSAPENLPDAWAQIRISNDNTIATPPTPILTTPIALNLSAPPYSFTLPTPYEIEYLDRNWDLVLYDDDDASVEIIGRTKFTPYILATNYPLEFTLHAIPNSSLIVVLEVEWTFY